MYDGMTHGVFFVNDTWGDDVVEDDDDNIDDDEDVGSRGGSIRPATSGGGGGGGDGRASGARSSYAGSMRSGDSREAMLLGSVGDASLNSIAKGGLKGIVGIFQQYAKNPENCGKSEYRYLNL